MSGADRLPLLEAAVEGSLARARALRSRGLLFMAAVEAKDAATAAGRFAEELERRARVEHGGARA